VPELFPGRTRLVEVPSADDRAIWDLWLSQYHLPVVLASDELGLFEFLRERPRTIRDICDGLNLLKRSVEALTAALASLGYLVQHAEHFQLTPIARLYLLRDSDFYWVPMLRSAGFGHMTTDALLEHLRTEHLDEGARISRRWERGEISPQDAHAANQRFHSHSMPAALGLARGYPFGEVHRLLDVAGGSGCFAIALAMRHPHLRCTIADLPTVAADARTYIERFNCQERVDTIGLNMFSEAWPTGYDAVFMSNVLHDWDPERRAHLVRSSFDALPPGGHLFLHEMLLNDPQDGPLPAALFSVMMLGTRGKQLSFAELESLVRGVGFVDAAARPTYGYYSLVSATKPVK
jgi:SAM-dependent methyltransferase